MRTAVIGAGIMGAGMARSLAREGHEVVLWNRTRSKAEAVLEQPDGASITVADDVTGAVEGADVVVTMLFDVDAVLAVAGDLVAALGDDAVWLQASTVGPGGVRRIAEAADAGTRLVDAPVLGTRKPAEEGQLVVLAAGDAAAIERAEPALAAVGSRTVHAGDEIGRASALKLACNSWVGLITAGTAQALALAEGQGLDGQLFLDAIEGGAADSPYAHVKGAQMLGGDYTGVSFEVDGVRKDLGLMVEAAGPAGVRDDLLRTLLAVYDDASQAGHGSEDIGAVRTAFGTGTGTSAG